MEKKEKIKKEKFKSDNESEFLIRLIKIFAAAFLLALILRMFPLEDLDFIKKSQIRIGAQVLNIEYARTDAQRTKGLSGRSELKTDSGMFFEYPEDGNYSFWMKDMLFPIDIIFLDRDYKVVDIRYNAQPCSEGECPGISPPNKFRFALEVNAGFSKESNLQIGDQIEILK